VSANALDEYKKLVETSRIDLEEHLMAIQHRLESIVPAVGTENNDERQGIQKEVESVTHCNDILVSVSEHISQLHEELEKLRDNESNLGKPQSNIIEQTKTFLAALGNSIAVQRNAISSGSRSMLGQISDKTLQNLSSDHLAKATSSNKSSDSDHDSNPDSVFSYGQSSATSRTSITSEGIAMTALDQFVFLLLDNEHFKLLCEEAIRSNAVGAYKFEKQLRQYLREYGYDLKQEALKENAHQRAAA
jgi:hypothetical protein